LTEVFYNILPSCAWHSGPALISITVKFLVTHSLKLPVHKRIH